MAESKCGTEFLNVLRNNVDLEIFDGNFKLRDRNHKVWSSIKERSKTAMSAKAIFLMFKFNSQNLRDDAQDLVIARRTSLNANCLSSADSNSLPCPAFEFVGVPQFKEEVETPCPPFEFVGVPQLKEEVETCCPPFEFVAVPQLKEEVETSTLDQKLDCNIKQEDASASKDIKPPPSLSIAESNGEDSKSQGSSDSGPKQDINPSAALAIVKSELQSEAKQLETGSVECIQKPVASLKRSRPLEECSPAKIPRYDNDALVLKSESDCDDHNCDFDTFYETRSFFTIAQHLISVEYAKNE